MRKGIQLTSWLTLIVIMATILFVAPETASAAEVRSGSEPSIGSGEVIDDDLYVFGGNVNIEGDVTGDLTVAAGTVDISGDIGGNLNVTGGTINVSGPVDGTIRVAAGTVNVRGPVGRDLVVAGGDVTLNTDAAVEQDVLIGAGNVRLNGDVGRDVRGGAGTLAINGEVGQDVRVEVETLRLGSQAQVGGDLIYTSDDEAEISDGAEVAGTTTRQEADRDWGTDTFASGLGWFANFFLRLGWALLAGTVLVLLLPTRARQVTNVLRRQPLVSLGWGVALLFLIPILTVFLLVTVIGVPLALILLALYLVALYLSQVIVGIALGRLILPDSWRPNERLRLWVAMLIGVTVVVLIRLLPIPFGWTFWVSLLVGFLALGAIWAALTGWGVSERDRVATESPATAP